MDFIYDKSKFLNKIEEYKRKYGESFDPIKLPRYLHSFEDFTAGKRDFLRNTLGLREPDGEQRPAKRIVSRKSPGHGPRRGPRGLKGTRSNSRSPFCNSIDKDHKNSSISTQPSPSHEQRTVIKTEPRSPSPQPTPATPTSEQEYAHSNISHNESMHSNGSTMSNVNENFFFENTEPPTSNLAPADDLNQSASVNEEKSPLKILNCDTILSDFIPDSQKLVSCILPKNIFFTPCFKKLFANIRSAWKVLDLNPDLIRTIASCSDEEKLMFSRQAEAGTFMACAQSLICSEKTENLQYTSVTAALENAQLPLIRGLRIIASQYGSVKCEIAGIKLTPIDHVADIRAAIRLATQLLPQSRNSAGEGNPSELKNSIITLSDEEARNISVRSWLPTYADDARFYFIIGCNIARAFEKKLGTIISPFQLVKSFRDKTFPKWWTSFQKYCLPKAGVNRLNFLFSSWTPQIMFNNLGNDKTGKAVLDALGLQWPNANVDHFRFDLTVDVEVVRIYRALSNFINVFGKYQVMMQLNDLGTNHLGSWNQMSSVICFQGMNILKANRATILAEQSLASRFPPFVYLNDRSN